jgi:septal ring-binding cell division protein DamX
VPDLGGFMAHSMDARFDHADNMFLPPYRTLGFNPQLKMNDSLLAQSYVEAYDVSYPEAVRRIESEVSELKQHLANEGYYEMNGIGVLTVNDDGNLEFEPCEAGILTPALYGLGNFEMKPAFGHKKQEKEQEKGQRKQGKAQKLTDKTDDGEQAIIIKMSWVRNAVAAAAAIVAFFLITTPVSNSRQAEFAVNTAEIPLMPKETPKAVRVTVDNPAAETVTTASPEATATPKAVAEMPKAATETPKAATETPKTATETAKTAGTTASKTTAGTPQSVEAPSANPAPKYCIVLASQVSQKNAETFAAQLRKHGLSDARVFINNNIRRVVCGSFSTEAAAYRSLPKVHQTEGCAEAWVYRVKN